MRADSVALSVALVTLSVAGWLLHAPSAAGTSPQPMTPAGFPVTQAKPAYAFVDSIGVNTHFAFGDTKYVKAYPQVKARLLELGVKHIRDGSMRAENYKAGTPSTAIWNDLAAHGIRLHMIAHARWSASDILEVLEANRASIVSIEGTNEPDLFLKGDWERQARDGQRLLWNTVKASAYAHLPVVAPALAGHAKYVKLGDLSRYADFANIHSYNGGRPPVANLDVQRQAVRQVAGSKAIYATETGYHSALLTKRGHLPISETGAAKYLPRMLFDYFEAGIVRTYLYQLYDHLPPALDNQEANFGLVRHDFTAKPAFTALANTIAILGDRPATTATGGLAYAIRPTLPAIRSSLLQKADGTFFLVLWQDVSVWDRQARVDIKNEAAVVTIAFPKAMHLKRYQPGISAEALEEKMSNHLMVAVPDEVVVLAISR